MLVKGVPDDQSELFFAITFMKESSTIRQSRYYLSFKVCKTQSVWFEFDRASRHKFISKHNVVHLTPDQPTDTL